MHPNNCKMSAFTQNYGGYSSCNRNFLFANRFFQNNHLSKNYPYLLLKILSWAFYC